MTSDDVAIHWKWIVGCLLVPVLLQVVLIALVARFGHRVPWYGNFGSQAISSTVGLGFLLTKYRWKGLLFGIAYVPAMFAVLVYLSLVIGAIFGDTL